MKGNHYLQRICLTLVGAVAGILVWSGCAAPKTAVQYRPPMILDPALSAETNGLCLVADPLFDSDRAKAYLDVDPRRLGLLAIHVRVENAHPSTTFLLQKENFKLLPAGGVGDLTLAKGGGYSPETEGRTGERVARGTPTTRALLALAFGGPNVDYSASVNHSFVREELRNQTLRPGQTASGCVYFQIPKREQFERGVLEIWIPDLGTQQPATILHEVSVFASPAAATGQADVLLVPKVARSTLVLPHPIDVGLVVEWMAQDRSGEQVLWLTTLESSAQSKKAGGRGVNAACQQCFDQLTRMTLEAFMDSAELRRISATRP